MLLLFVVVSFISIAVVPHRPRLLPLPLEVSILVPLLLLLLLLFVVVVTWAVVVVEVDAVADTFPHRDLRFGLSVVVSFLVSLMVVVVAAAATVGVGGSMVECVTDPIVSTF